MTIAVPPSITVYCVVKTVAVTIIGANKSKANGLLRPPVRYNKNANCNKSKRTIRKISASDNRFVAGKMNIAKKLPITETPTARKQSPSSSCKSKKTKATVKAMIWPKIATHRTRIIVRKRIQCDRCCSPSIPKSG